MSKYLISTTEVYRVDTEKDALLLIEEAKHNPFYNLNKYQTIHKTKKQKGEIVDEWYRVVLTKEIDDEKDPLCEVTISYRGDTTIKDREEWETDEDGK